MEDHQEPGSGSRGSPEQPVRSRWTPKPEQILILESIFNSGMVNPPKDETVRIRKLLEKFGSVGDANVFYWFQNRRSRSRRRQRQIQATLCAAADHSPQPHPIHYDSAAAYNPAAVYPVCSATAAASLVGPGISPSLGLAADGYFSFSGQPAGIQELHHHGSIFPLDEGSNLQYQSGVITVFINGVATELGRGPVDVKAMFGGDFVVFHSSGAAVEVNEHGFLVQSLQHGESYFLVSREERQRKLQFLLFHVNVH